MPKDRCVICLLPFKDGGEVREKRFESYGNFCHRCNLRAQDVISGEISELEADKEVRELRRKNKKLKV